MGRAFMHGWVSLPTQGEVYLEHGLPRRLWIVGAADVERLVDEIADLTGLNVTLGRWEAGDEVGQVEAAVNIDARDIGEVLRRLALVSAETYYDRYRKPIEASDVDYDDEAYAQDCNFALDACGLNWKQIDDTVLRSDYRRALHRAIEEIARHPE